MQRTDLLCQGLRCLGNVMYQEQSSEKEGHVEQVIKSMESVINVIERRSSFIPKPPEQRPRWRCDAPPRTLAPILPHAVAV